MPKKSALLSLLLFATTCLIRESQPANILCMFTSSGKSQLIVFMAVANTLIDRGHNVTIVTTIPIPPQLKGKHEFRHIYLEQSLETIKKLNDNIQEMAEEVSSKFKIMLGFVTTINLLTTIQVDALKQEKFQKFLQEDNHFDLVLLGYFYNDYMVGVGARYKCPIAVVNLASPFGPVSRMIGNPEEASYVQFPLLGCSQPMSFSDRFLNFIWAAVEPCAHYFASKLMESYYETLFTGEIYPKYSEIITNVSLVLFNKHFTDAPIRPLVPALVEIGGIQINEEPDVLPKDIQDFLDSSVNGVILFVVGLRMNFSYLKPEQIKIVSRTLAGLDMDVLWEWEMLVDGKPPINAPNIRFREGLPVEDILAHPKIRLYITDGRPSACFAAQYRGVPILGIPLYADEFYIIEEMTNRGFGISVNANNLSESYLKDAIHEVLERPYYTQAVKHFSKIYRDRPISARESAAFWLEYVIRYRGAPHMQSPLVHMTFVERWNIDVIVVLLCLLYAFVMLIKLVVFLVRKIFPSLGNNNRVTIKKYKHC